VIACGVAAAVSIHDGLPARWGRGFAGPLALDSSPRRTLTAFLTWRGTAIAPPLPILVLLLWLAILAAAGRTAAVGALTAVVAATIVGFFGEPLVRRVLFSHADATKTTVVAVELVLSLFVVAAGLRARVRSRSV
jgi:hypothetical protein